MYPQNLNSNFSSNEYGVWSNVESHEVDAPNADEIKEIWNDSISAS